jgi:hypothetical protein
VINRVQEVGKMQMKVKNPRFGKNLLKLHVCNDADGIPPH